MSQADCQRYQSWWTSCLHRRQTAAWLSGVVGPHGVDIHWYPTDLDNRTQCVTSRPCSSRISQNLWTTRTYFGCRRTGSWCRSVKTVPGTGHQSTRTTRSVKPIALLLPRLSSAGLRMLQLPAAAYHCGSTQYVHWQKSAWRCWRVIV